MSLFTGLVERVGLPRQKEDLLIKALIEEISQVNIDKLEFKPSKTSQLEVYDCMVFFDLMLKSRSSLFLISGQVRQECEARVHKYSVAPFYLDKKLLKSLIQF